MVNKNNNFKETLWKTAEKLRNQMDAAEYKHIVLGLIFLKYISDSFEEQREKISKNLSDPDSDFFISENLSDYENELEDRDYYTQDNVFWVPKEARWETLRSQAKQPDIGSLIDAESSLATIKDEKSIRASIGFGLSWRSPFGPIVFDFSKALLKKDFDKTETIRLDLGARF